MPAEGERHARTFMAWPRTGGVWGRAVRWVQDDVAGVARAVAEFEPVVMLASPEDAADARWRCGTRVEVWEVPVDDLWIRDTGPVFVSAEEGIDLGFNGWGGKHPHARDALVAREVLAGMGARRIVAPLVGEGGGLEVDGVGTLMATESSLVNPNRNPGMDRAAIEAALKGLLGVTKVLWLEGLAGHDVTDCHVDGLARFAAPGVVALGRPAPGTPLEWVRVHERARRVLADATDARGKPLEIVELPEPADVGRRGPGFFGSYVNHYVVNGAVIAPRFRDRAADDRAAGILRELYPGRAVVQCTIDTLAEGGGGIHCATQQQPQAAAPLRH